MPTPPASRCCSRPTAARECERSTLRVRRSPKPPPLPLDTPVGGGGVEPLQLRVFADGIRTLEIDAAFGFGLFELAVLERAAGLSQQQRRVLLLARLERYTAEEPLLEPDRRYRLRVRTSVGDAGGASLEGAQSDSATGTFTGGRWHFVDEFDFRTEGPPGDAQLAPTGPGADARAPLDTLDAYAR